jgi:hypothetical protein
MPRIFHKMIVDAGMRVECDKGCSRMPVTVCQRQRDLD